MKTNNPRILFLLVFLLGIVMTSYSQPFTLKSTQFGFVKEPDRYHDINYFIFNDNIITLYNENSQVRTKFIIYKYQDAYDAELKADLNIFDCYDTRNNENVRIILTKLINTDLHLLLNDIIFYDLEFVDN